MKRASRLLSLLLVVGVAAQVAWAEIPFIHHRTPANPTPALTISTASTDFIQAHVPRGQSIIYVTNTATDEEPYFLLSTALVDRNQVWWAAPAPVTNVTDWWYDVSSGAPAVLALAKRFHARYVVFDKMEVPAALPVTAAWRENGDLAVVELAVSAGG